MEQFRQVGEALGSLKALLVFQESIEINRKQCLLLLDLFEAAYRSISDEMRNGLRFEERGTSKWKVLEQPLRDLRGIFREGEAYVQRCLANNDHHIAGDGLEDQLSSAKAVALLRSRECVEFHVHNLLSCVAIVVEAIEAAGDGARFSGRFRKEFRVDFRVFRRKFGREYLVGPEFCERFESVRREDFWGFFGGKKKTTKKRGSRFIELLCERFDPCDSNEVFLDGKLFPSSILLGSKDYQVRRRLGFGGHYKEILWLGESFATRHFYGDSEPFIEEISLLLSISHPNIANALCGFADEEKREWFLVMELMSKDLNGYIKEICGPRKKIPFSVSAAVDLMLQIARGMEYLHSKGIRHGDLNPSNVLVKARATNGGYLHAKVSGFGLSSVKSSVKSSSPAPNEKLSFIWLAPEILDEQEQTGLTLKSEKSDIYSFGMVCFEVLTGKVPFEDSHLQGDKMGRNIRAGERPLFPYQVPKYLTNLTKKCWHSDPTQRPGFSSICRVLRYIKRFVALNPEPNSQQDQPVPTMDYFEIESGLMRSISWWSDQPLSVSQIPFQMFVYRAEERERTSANVKENSEESGSDAASLCGDDSVSIADDVFLSNSERKALASPDSVIKKIPSMKRSAESKVTKPEHTGPTRSRSVKPPQINPIGRSMRRNSESQLTLTSPRIRRPSSSGHASDSELP